MKLNLLPATVSKGARARTAWIGSVGLIVLSSLASAFMIVSSQSQLREVKQQVANMRPRAQEAYETATQADTIIARADNVVRNRLLADAMLKHSTKYPDLYDQVRNFIPSFYRITNLSATPIDDKTAQVTMTGTLDTYQQYADLMLALLRFPGATAVGRSGYVPTEQIVPALTEVDQNGRPRRPEEAPIPDDPYERLAYFQSQASTQNYTGAGNFGTGTEDTRFARPDSSLVSVTLIVSRDLRVPDARGTLGGASAGAPAGGGAAPASFAPPTGAGAPGGGGGTGPAADDL